MLNFEFLIGTPISNKRRLELDSDSTGWTIQFLFCSKTVPKLFPDQNTCTYQIFVNYVRSQANNVSYYSNSWYFDFGGFELFWNFRNSFD